MASTYNKEWNNLSIEEKRDVIRVALKNGIRELPDIKAKYNEFAGGGSFYQRHRARWNNYLLRHGVPEQQAAKLSTFFAAQDALESGHGTSDAAIGKNNFGGMQRLDKKSNKMVNISYPSVDAYMDAKWKMMQNRFGRALNANSIQEYSNLLNDPRYHGKGYMYALYEGYRDGKPLDVAKQIQHMNNYTKILMDIAGEKGFKGASVPAGQAGEAPASIARPENPYTQYTPAEPFFNQNMTFVRPEDVRKAQEENALKMAESQNAAMQQERKQSVDSFNTLMGLLHTPNNGNSSILGTIATLASLNKNNRFDTGGFKQQPRQYIYDVLPSLFAKDGVKITVSSGFRPGAKTVEGKPSRHSLKQAADIVGDFKAIRRVLDDPNSYTSRWLLANGYGYLDETSATGTTKFWHDHKRDHSHYHIGMDSGIVSKYASMMNGRAQNPLPAQQNIVEQPVELAQTSDIPFTPSNPQAFFGVHPAQQQSVYDYVTTPTVEEPVYDPMVEEKNDALSNLSKINAIMQLTSPSNNNNNSFLNTVGLFANMSAEGGPIHIKPENRGKFTALKERTGHSATWFKEHGTPAQRKMATFALNARHWKHGYGGNLFSGEEKGSQQMKGREGAARSYTIDGITYGAPYYNYDEPGRPLYRNATLPEIVITPPDWNFEREREKALIRKRRNSKYKYIPETSGMKVYDATKKSKVRKAADKVLDFLGFTKSDQQRLLSDLQYLGLAAEGGENGTAYGIVAPGILNGTPVGKGVNTGVEVLSKKAAVENLTPTQRIFKFLGKDVPAEKASEWVKPEGVSEAKAARWSMRHQIVRDNPLIADLRAQGVDVEKIGLDDLKKLQELRKQAIKDAFETSGGRYAITDATSGAKLYGENVGAELQTYKGKPAEPGAIGSLNFENMPLDKYLEQNWARYDREGAVPVLNPELYEGLKVPGMIQNYARDYGVKGVSKDLYSASLFDMAERGTGKGIASGTVLLSPEKTTRVVSPKNFNLVEISPNAGWHKYTMETLDGTPAASWQEGPITGITGTTSPIQFPVKNGSLFDVGIIDNNGIMHIDPTIGSSVRKALGGHIYDGTTEDTQQMNIPYVGELPDVLVEGKKRNNVLRQVKEHWVTNDKGEEVPTYWGYNPTSKQYEQLYKLTGDTDMENSVFSTYDNRHTFNVPQATEMRKAYEQWIKNGAYASGIDEAVLGYLLFGVSPIALPEIAAGVTAASDVVADAIAATPWGQTAIEALSTPLGKTAINTLLAYPGLNNFFSSEGYQKTANAFNEGRYGDAALSAIGDALDLSMAAPLAKDVYTVASPLVKGAYNAGKEGLQYTAKAADNVARNISPSYDLYRSIGETTPSVRVRDPYVDIKGLEGADKSYIKIKSSLENLADAKRGNKNEAYYLFAPKDIDILKLRNARFGNGKAYDGPILGSGSVEGKFVSYGEPWMEFAPNEKTALYEMPTGPRRGPNLMATDFRGNKMDYSVNEAYNAILRDRQFHQDIKNMELGDILQFKRDNYPDLIEGIPTDIYHANQTVIPNKNWNFDKFLKTPLWKYSEDSASGQVQKELMMKWPEAKPLETPTIEWEEAVKSPQTTAENAADDVLAAASGRPFKYEIGTNDKVEQYLTRRRYSDKIHGKPTKSFLDFDPVTGDFVQSNERFAPDVVKGLPTHIQEDLMHNTVGRNMDAFINEGVTAEEAQAYVDRAKKAMEDVHIGRYSNYDYEKAGYDKTGGFYDDKNNFISVNEGSSFPKEFVEKHEGRHLIDYQADDAVLMPEITGSDYDADKVASLMQRTKQKQNMVLGDAYDNDFLTIPESKFADGLESYSHMSREAVTTNRDARDVLFSKHNFGEQDRLLQNKYIDKMSDDEIFDAVSKANGYGRRFIERLKAEGKLTPKKAKQFREAMKYVGAVATPVGVGLTAAGIASKTSDKK